MNDIEKEVKRIEKETGKFVRSFQIGKSGGLENVELMPYGPGDFILDVWNIKIHLMRAIPTTEGYAFENVLPPAAYEREDVQEWLEQALDACGGYINISGHYPLTVSIPNWLEPEIVIAALGR